MTPRAQGSGPGSHHLVRPFEDPLSPGVESLPGTRVSKEAWQAAQSLSVVLASDGRRPPIVDRYLDALARAPVEHVRLLSARKARIVFAPTVPEALESPWTADRRGRLLTSQERLDVRARYGRAAGTAALYEPEIDALILPTTYAGLDLERAVMHELGHALTMPLVSVRASLLENLPPAIASHVRDPGYGDPRESGTLRSRVHEALAEAYVYLIVGRCGELPAALLSDLLFILTAVSEEGSPLRFNFDEETGRTASFVDPATLLDSSDPDQGDLFASPSAPGERLEAVELAGDELAPRRRLRRAA